MAEALVYPLPPGATVLGADVPDGNLPPTDPLAAAEAAGAGGGGGGGGEGEAAKGARGIRLLGPTIAPRHCLIRNRGPGQARPCEKRDADRIRPSPFPLPHHHLPNRAREASGPPGK
jgi:hypothetical protein